MIRHNRETGALTRQEVSGAEFGEMVEAASRQSAVWTPEDVGVQYETDVPWGSWAQADRDRSYRSAYADDGAWPRSVRRDLWDALIGAWGEAGQAEDVLDALMGGETEVPETAQHAVSGMEALSDVLTEEPEGGVRTVAHALANRVLKLGVPIKTGDGQSPYEALSAAIGWYLGVDLTYG